MNASVPVRRANAHPVAPVSKPSCRVMLAQLFSHTLIGIDAAPVEAEVDVSASSMPKTVLVGLAERASSSRVAVPSCGHP
jgi:hypothetical protein